MSALPVTIVRPNLSWATLIGRFFGRLIGSALGVLIRGWILMLALQALVAPPLALGYWHSVVAVLGAYALFSWNRLSMYDYWSRSHSGSEVKK